MTLKWPPQGLVGDVKMETGKSGTSGKLRSLVLVMLSLSWPKKIHMKLSKHTVGYVHLKE